VPQTIVIIEIRPILLFTLHNTKNIAYHITEELILKSWYSMQTKSRWWANSKNFQKFAGI